MGATVREVCAWLVLLFVFGIGGSYSRCTPEPTDAEREVGRAAQAYIAAKKEPEAATSAKSIHQQFRRFRAQDALDAAVDAFADTPECTSACHHELNRTDFEVVARTTVVLKYVRLRAPSRVEWIEAIFLGACMHWIAGCFAVLLFMKRADDATPELSSLLGMAIMFWIPETLGLAIWFCIHQIFTVLALFAFTIGVYIALRLSKITPETRERLRRIVLLLGLATAVAGVVFRQNPLVYVPAALGIWNPVWQLADSFRSWNANAMRSIGVHFARLSAPRVGSIGSGGALISLAVTIPLLIALVIKGIHIVVQLPDGPLPLLDIVLVLGGSGTAVLAMIRYIYIIYSPKTTKSNASLAA